MVLPFAKHILPSSFSLWPSESYASPVTSSSLWPFRKHVRGFHYDAEYRNDSGFFSANVHELTAAKGHPWPPRTSWDLAEWSREVWVSHADVRPYREIPRASQKPSSRVGNLDPGLQIEWTSQAQRSVPNCDTFPKTCTGFLFPCWPWQFSHS